MKPNTNQLLHGGLSLASRANFGHIGGRLISGIASGRNAILALLAAAAATLLSCESATPVLQNQMVVPSSVNLAPGDVVKFSFTGAPELNQSQKIRADGKLSLPMIGEVIAAGKSLSQLQSELVTLYKSQLKNSEVFVTLESGVSQVYVSGAVAKPGKITIERPTTVLEAVMEAGGFTEFANIGSVRVIHLVNGQQYASTLDLRPALSGQKTRAYYITSNDVIYVPTKLMSF
jgi:polysaccharide biosynthesis/export protein